MNMTRLKISMLGIAFILIITGLALVLPAAAHGDGCHGECCDKYSSPEIRYPIPPEGVVPFSAHFHAKPHDDWGSDGGSKRTIYYWTFGDGGTSTQKEPTHSYTVPGFYPVSLHTEWQERHCTEGHYEHRTPAVPAHYEHKHGQGGWHDLDNGQTSCTPSPSCRYIEEVPAGNWHDTDHCTIGENCRYVPVECGDWHMVCEDNDEGFVTVTANAPENSYISGMKFSDANNNGIKDPEEMGLGGWTIELRRNEPRLLTIDGDGDDHIQCPPCQGEPYATTITDEDGDYSFSDLPEGLYCVKEVQQSGYTQTFPPDNKLPYGFACEGIYFLGLDGQGYATEVDFGNYMAPVEESRSGSHFTQVDAVEPCRPDADGSVEIEVTPEWNGAMLQFAISGGLLYTENAQVATFTSDGDYCELYLPENFGHLVYDRVEAIRDVYGSNGVLINMVPPAHQCTHVKAVFHDNPVNDPFNPVFLKTLKVSKVESTGFTHQIYAYQYLGPGGIDIIFKHPQEPCPVPSSLMPAEVPTL